MRLEKAFILWMSPLRWQVFQAILLKYAFVMAIHTVWISIQLHTMGSCWMKNTRIPESSKGKTFIPSRPSCWGFDKTQQWFLLLHNDMLTLWVFSPMSPSSQITPVDRIAICGVGGDINTAPAAVVSCWSWSITEQSFSGFCFVLLGFLFSKNKPLSHWSCTEGREAVPFLFCSRFVSGIGQFGWFPAKRWHRSSTATPARVLFELCSERTSTSTHWHGL